MKQKILEALKQGYGKGSKLGLGDDCEAFERVASLAETFITSEEQIPNFVQGAESIFKDEQSKADKKRSELAALKKEYEGKVADLEAKLNGNSTPEPQVKPQPQPTEQPDLVAQFSAMLDAKLNPLQEKINAFETEKAAQTAVDAAKAEFFEQAAVKAYQGVGNSAWRNTLRVFNSEGKKWSKDELLKALNEEFNTSCSEQNLDTTKPTQGDGGSGAPHDFKAMATRLQERGKIAATEA